MDREDLGQMGELVGLCFETDRAIRVLMRDRGWTEGDAPADLRALAARLQGAGPRPSRTSLLLASPDLAQAATTAGEDEIQSSRNLAARIAGNLEQLASGAALDAREMAVTRAVVRHLSIIASRATSMAFDTPRLPV